MNLIESNESTAIIPFEGPRELAALGLRPPAVFLTSPKTMAGARAAGMRAIWRRDPSVSGVVEADAVIEELGDLLTLLGLKQKRL